MLKRKQEVQEKRGSLKRSTHKGKDSKESLRCMCSSHTTCNLNDLLGHIALVLDLAALSVTVE